jgi:hypothetical protein
MRSSQLGTLDGNRVQRIVHWDPKIPRFVERIRVGMRTE